jgi:hypothetical protein
MKRLLLAVIVIQSMTVAETVLAQGFDCSTERPLCPDDGSVPFGNFPDCGCPKPSSCGDFPDFSYSCAFDNFDVAWSCICTDLRQPGGPGDTPPPPGEEPDFCSSIRCPDGSAAHGVPGTGGFVCACSDGTSPKASLSSRFDPRHWIAGTPSKPNSRSSARRMFERLMRQRDLLVGGYCVAEPARPQILRISR